MKNIFLMAESDIQSLRLEIKRQLDIGRPRQRMADSTYLSESNGTEVMRIHGPVLSRRSWISELLGLRTTEEHMDTLSDMLATGSDVLLDIDTGGGDANLAFEFADMIRSGGDRVTAYSGGYAASAGMLFLTAASQSYAHRSANLGSIGVVGYANFSDDENALYSDNAKNKKPNRANVQRDINETESLFHEYVATGTGLSSEQIIQRGNRGDIFSGQSAATSGFIDGTTTLQDLISGKPSSQEQQRHDQMLAFVAAEMTKNPNVKAETLLSNYVALNPTTDTLETTKKSQSDDWESRLEFIRTRVSNRQPAKPKQQQRQPCQQASGSDWESRLAFMRQYARGNNV